MKQTLLSPGTSESWGEDLPTSSYQGHFTVNIKDALWESWTPQLWRLMDMPSAMNGPTQSLPLVITPTKGLTGSYPGHLSTQVTCTGKDLKT